MDPARPKSLGRVLVVGGCGMLGSHFVEQLLNFPNEENHANGQVKKPARRLAPRTPSSTLPHSTSFEFPTLRSRYPSCAATEVHVLDLRCNKNRVDGATYHEADITNAEAVMAVFKKARPDIIFHTASPVFDAPKAVLRKVNIGGTQVLLEVAGGQRGDWGGVSKAFIYTSSSSVIHDGSSDLINADEKYSLLLSNPNEYYSQTKAEAENLVIRSNRQYKGLLTCAIRPAGIMGERDVQYSYKILEHAVAAPPWQLRLQLGDNNNLFDVTYAGNIAFAHILAGERLLETHKRIADGAIPPLDHERVDGEAFGLTNDSPAASWDLIRFLWSMVGLVLDTKQIVALPEWFAWPLGMVAQAVTTMLGRPSNFTPDTVRRVCMVRYFNCVKARQRLGYAPLIGVEEGLTRSTKSFLEQYEAKMSLPTKKMQ